MTTDDREATFEQRLRQEFPWARDEEIEAAAHRLLSATTEILAAEVGVLREALQAAESFDGVMAYIDKTYPAAVFDGSSGDAGPRLVVLMRENVTLREALTALHDAGNRLCRLLGARRLGQTDQELGWDDEAIAEWNAVCAAMRAAAAAVVEQP